MAEHTAPEHPAREPRIAAVEPLLCPVCGSHLLQLLDAEPHAPGGWDVVLECPECWSILEDHLEDLEIEAFDRDFDDGMHVIVDELRRLTVEQMRQDVERFAGA